MSAPARSDNLRGIVAMLVAMAAFVINDTLLKVTVAWLPTGEVIFLRGVFTTLLCGALIARSGIFWALPHALTPRVIGRAVADVGAAIFFLLALMQMPFGDAYAILQFTPLAITAAAALFLGAKVGWRRWSAAVLGLIGVLIIVRPGGAAFNAYSLLALTSTFFSVARDLLTRGVGMHVPSLVIAGASTTAITLASLVFAGFEAWKAPPPQAVALLLAASVALLAGQHWLIAAMRAGEIAVVAPFRYSIILWALMSGFLVWREVPDPITWIGIAIVTGAGLYTFLREQRLAKAAKP
jgi:drug/metabolite transporter (DMT)-like permease